jgi:hypothetical protein
MIINVYYVEILFFIVQIKRTYNIVYLIRYILLHINDKYVIR